MYLMYLLILILCFKGSISEISTYKDKGLYFLCVCEGHQNDRNTTIECGKDKVIQIEPSGHIMRDNIRKREWCGTYPYYQCRDTSRLNILNLADRIEVYKKCSHQNSCNITIGGVEDGQQRLVNYPFYCRTESSIIDLSQKTGKTINHPIFYFTGEKFTGQKIDCDCSVSGSDQIRLEMFFIHLKPNSSSRVRFLTQNFPLFGSSNRRIMMLRTYFGYIGRELKLEIRGMEPDKDDVIFFRVLGLGLFVNCSGCTNTTDNKISTSSIDTTTDFPSTKPPTTDPVTIATTSDVLVSAASTDQTNDGTITVLGAILGAVILINIVGIALYCFLRHRKKQEKTPYTSTNTSGNGEQSLYNYIDLTQDIHGSSSTNGVQNGDPQKSSDVYSVESIMKTRDSQDGPNNQYHVLEVDAYSAPTDTRTVDDARQKPGNERRKQDDYDHIHGDTNSSIFKTNNTNTYNHINTKMAVPGDATPKNNTQSNDYSHFENQNGVSNGNLERLGGDKTKQGRKENNLNSGHEKTSYVNVNLEPDETPSSSDDVDTYNHLQN